MWNDVLKAPYVQPFSAGSERVEGKLVGGHPLPLVGRYYSYLNNLLDNKHRHSFMKWWKHGRLRTVGTHEEQNAARRTMRSDNPVLLPISGLEHMRAFIEYTVQSNPPTWEEFVSKIDEQDEFKAASVIFGDEFPKTKQDLERIKEPSFRYRKPEKQAQREQRHLNDWKKNYTIKVKKVYEELGDEFLALFEQIELELEDLRRSEYYTRDVQPRLISYEFLKEIANELKDSGRFLDAKVAESQKGLVILVRPKWIEDLEKKYFFHHQIKRPDGPRAWIRMKTNPSTGAGPSNTCIDLIKIENNKKSKIHTVCLYAPDVDDRDGSLVWANDFYGSILLALANTKNLRDFERLAPTRTGGQWTWQQGGYPEAADRITWNVPEGEQMEIYNKLMGLIGDLKIKFSKWGQYWVKEVGPVEPKPIEIKEMDPEELDRIMQKVKEHLRHTPNDPFRQFRRSEDKNVNNWENVLKAKAPGRKIHHPRSQTHVYGNTPGEISKRKLLPTYVQNNTTHEWIGGVSVQYNAFIDMFIKNTNNNNLLMASWYLRSYVPKIHSAYQRALGGNEPSNPFTGTGQSLAPHQIIPIKSITGKLLSYAYFKYNKRIPEINFIALIPRANHPRGQGANLLDVGNGKYETNWEDNAFIKNHIKGLYGAAEIGETEEAPKHGRTIGDTMTEEDKRKLGEGLDE
jgi:hypothetical protein